MKIESAPCSNCRDFHLDDSDKREVESVEDYAVEQVYRQFGDRFNVSCRVRIFCKSCDREVLTR